MAKIRTVEHIQRIIEREWTELISTLASLVFSTKRKLQNFTDSYTKPQVVECSIIKV